MAINKQMISIIGGYVNDQLRWQRIQLKGFSEMKHAVSGSWNTGTTNPVRRPVLMQ